MESSNESIPKSSPRRNVAGWSELVQPHKERAVFWHRVWNSIGGHRQGVVYDIMLRTRDNYKRISCQVIRSQGKQRMLRMASDILQNYDLEFN
jgi:hypothetical protein